MSDYDFEFVRELTRLVRAADEQFEAEGGSTRHWVRGCFLPRLESAPAHLRRAMEELLKADDERRAA